MQLYNIPFYEYATVCLFILLLIQVWVFLAITNNANINIPFGEHNHAFLWGMYLRFGIAESEGIHLVSVST